MSHFVGLCFGENWENDIERYCENNEVEPYIEYTKEEAIERVMKKHEEDYNNAVEILKRDSLIESTLKYYSDKVAKGPSITREDAWKEVLDWGYELDKDENVLSTYNPESKWDWYSIGGRWSGFLVLKERDSDGDIVETNTAYMYEIDWEYMKEHRWPPFCFIDTDGEWHEKGEMGWFGVSFNEKPETTWKQHYEDYLKEVDSECLVTVVDFHI